MVYTPLSYTNGQYLDAVRLNQSDANDDHVRAETEFKLLVSGGSQTITGSEPNDDHAVTLDTTDLATYTTGGSKTLLNQDISSYSDGYHTMTFTVDGTDFVFHFVKTEDMNYLSIWVHFSTASVGSVYTKQAREITVIGHRSTESWI